jgi:periplasmic mercuric ion binding protein
MQRPRLGFLASLCAAFALGGAVRAETKVELKRVHLCCPACVRTVAGIVKKVDGVKVACDRKERTVTLSAPNDEAAQKALDALAATGFHGDTGNDKLAMKDDSGVAKGKTSSLSLTNVHNCCGTCCRAIKETVKKVQGVTGDTAMRRMSSFTVTGDFDAAEVVKALNAAGFHAKVEQK